MYPLRFSYQSRSPIPLLPLRGQQDVFPHLRFDRAWRWDYQRQQWPECSRAGSERCCAGGLADFTSEGPSVFCYNHLTITITNRISVVSNISADGGWVYPSF